MARSPEYLTHKEIQPLSLKEIVRLGENTVIAYGAWGEPIDNQKLIERFVGDRPDRKTIVEMVEGTGISVRHHNPSHFRERDNSLIAKEEIEIGARLTRDALDANNWEKIDLFITATSNPPCDNFAEQIAERAGLANVETRLYCLACDGAIAAFHDVLRSDKLKNRVVITAVEGLSHEVNLNLKGGELDKVRIAAMAIFGNGAASFAFSPKDFELFAGRTGIVPDEYGVISLSKSYDLPPPEERLKPPPWYRVEPEADKLFAFTSKKVMMKLPETNADYAQMDGIATAKFFTKHVPPEVWAVLEEYYQQYGDGQPIRIGVSHQPSKVVLKLVGNRLAKMGYSNLEIPWVLDKIGMGNVSSATTFLAWAQLKDRLPKGEPFIVIGFGVGAAVTPVVVSMNV